jgi:hypothetical protein
MKSITLVTVLSLLAGSALAQERAAGQANDAQVNWSILSAKLDAIDNQNKAIAASVVTLQTSVNGINTKMDAIAACGAQQKVWNGTGCVTTLAPKAEVGTFSMSVGYGGQSTPTGAAFCQSKGYDTAVSKVAQTSERHTGGSTGGMESYISGYTYTCVRVVNR